jgi:hypothetical protein
MALFPPFSCRTLAPWDEVKWGFRTSVGLQKWLNELYGEDLVTYSQLEGVREWMKGAKEGDVINLDDDARIVPQGDIEIRCNRTV